MYHDLQFWPKKQTLFQWKYLCGTTHFLFMENKTKLNFSLIKNCSSYKQGSRIHREKINDSFLIFWKENIPLPMKWPNINSSLYIL